MIAFLDCVQINSYPSVAPPSKSKHCVSPPFNQIIIGTVPMNGFSQPIFDLDLRDIANLVEATLNLHVIYLHIICRFLRDA